jgi:3-methyl-2-oxobutanoate hydroxymethyltransferase
MLKVPTIGIGAGPHCDGQVLVFHDIVGLFKKFTPRFVKRYADLEAPMKQAVSRFVKEVSTGKFPGKEHGFAMPLDEKRAFESRIAGLLPTFTRRRQ